MENFNVGEIVWAKIRGYPWWPALITRIEDDNKEKKYYVGFLGDNTHATLPKKCLGKFQKEFKSHSNTKKKILLQAIKIAKEMYENKSKGEDVKLEEPRETEKGRNQDKKKKATSIDSDEEEKIESEDKEKGALERKKTQNGAKVGSNKMIPQETESSLLNRKKRRVSEEKKENNEVNDLIRKIINYLVFISKNIEKNELKEIENDKPCLIKVLDFLKEYKMSDPIEFLKKTCIGKMIKYINSQTEDSDIKESTTQVYKNFEEQVLDQLFRKAK